MTNTKHGRYIAWATTACLVLLGIMFIICCAHLYFTGGDQPYSRERVGSYLIILAIPSAITVALVVSGFIYAYLTGAADDENAPRTSSELLESYRQRYDIFTFSEDVQKEISRERGNRTAFKLFSYIFSAVVLAVVFAYMMLIAEFSVETLNADVIAALTVALPLSVIALGIHVPRVYIAEASATRELEIMKGYIRENKPQRISRNDEAVGHGDTLLIAKCLMVAVAAALVILGIFNGGVSDVFAKAVKICTECIGLG